MIVRYNGACMPIEEAIEACLNYVAYVRPIGSPRATTAEMHPASLLAYLQSQSAHLSRLENVEPNEAGTGLRARLVSLRDVEQVTITTSRGPLVVERSAALGPRSCVMYDSDGKIVAEVELSA